MFFDMDMTIPAMSLQVVTPTLSMRVNATSPFLSALDSLFFCVMGLLAIRFWIQTRRRTAVLRQRGLDFDMSRCREILLLFLSASNLCRGFCVVVCTKYARHWAKLSKTLVESLNVNKHRKMGHCIDYLASSLPTMLWESMLTVLIFVLVEAYFLSQLKNNRIRFLRTTITFLNVVGYLLYAAVAFLTFRLASFKEFGHYIFFFLGCIHISTGWSLIYYGVRLLYQIRPGSQASDYHKHLAALVSRLTWVLICVPFTECWRGIANFRYAFNLVSEEDRTSAAQLGFMKFLTEWVPCMVVVYAFRPHDKTQPVEKPKQGFVDPLLSPGQMMLAPRTTDHLTL